MTEDYILYQAFVLYLSMASGRAMSCSAVQTAGRLGNGIRAMNGRQVSQSPYAARTDYTLHTTIY